MSFYIYTLIRCDIILISEHTELENISGQICTADKGIVLLKIHSFVSMIFTSLFFHIGQQVEPNTITLQNPGNEGKVIMNLHINYTERQRQND